MRTQKSGNSCEPDLRSGCAPNVGTIGTVGHSFNQSAIMWALFANVKTVIARNTNNFIITFDERLRRPTERQITVSQLMLLKKDMSLTAERRQTQSTD